VEAALARTAVKANTMIVDAPRFTSALLGREFDGSGAAWRDAEREKLLLFSRPYLENRLVLLGRRGSDVSAKSFDSLTGKRIAIVEGYSYGDAIDQSSPTFVRSKSEEDSLSLLLKSAVDYVLMDELVVQYIVANHPNEVRTRLQLGSTPLVVRPLHLAVRRSLPNAEAIVNGFNAQLRSMITDRTYHRLLRVDWIRADVDGDGLAENVPRSDQLGPVEPQSSYALFSADAAKAPSQSSNQRFYFGGTVYDGWKSVPEMYKTPGANRTDPGTPTTTLFQFRW
jgi:polar amino acid transport system substrate-binding protein